MKEYKMDKDILETQAELESISEGLNKLQGKVAMLEETFDKEFWDSETKYLSADLNALRVLLFSANSFLLSMLSDEVIFDNDDEVE
jgi:hypothetical protein